MPVSSTRLDEPPLDAGQLEVVAVAPLADGAAAEEPGLVADDDHGDLAARGGGHGVGEARDGRSSSTAQPRGERDLASGHSAASALRTVGTRMPAGVPGCWGRTWLTKE